MMRLVPGQDKFRGWTWPAILLFGAIILSGCSLPKMTRALNDTDPTAKIPAIKSSGASRNRESVTQLIDELESDDSAVRFYAIRALKDITGESFGYRYFDDELERRDEVARWRAWLAKETGQAVPATVPASAPTTAASNPA